MPSLIPSPIPDPIRLRKLNNRHQLIIDSEAAFRQVTQLDPMYWSVNSAPTEGLSCNQLFLQHLDSDSNQRIMPFEIILACQWMLDTLSSLDDCIHAQPTIPLANFRADTPQGLRMKNTATLVLQNLGKQDQDSICLSEIQAKTAIVASGAANGDGILPPSALEGSEKEFAVQLLQIVGGKQDINGEFGINEEILRSFPAQANAWIQWRSTCPHPTLTPEMVDIAQQIQPQIDQHFVDQRLPPPTPKEAPLTTSDQTHLRSDLWVHPRYREEWKSFWNTVLEPLQITALDWQQWERVWSDLQEYQRWLSAKPTGNFERISLDALQRICEEQEIIDALLDKLKQDQEVSLQLQELANLEKTILFQQHLCTFLNSFVNFSDFYNPSQRSLPEIGALLLDGRWFRLVVQVPDLEQHKKQAANSGFFLIYLAVSLSAEKTVHIAVAVTGSERGDLHLGKKGVFYDTQQRQCSAEIIHIIDNPINIKEAFFQPLERIQQILRQRFERFSAEQEKKIEGGLKPETQAPIDKNLLMGGGVTIAALSSSFAYLIKTLTSVDFSSILLIILAPLGILTLISSVIAGWKLHKRDLGPILEASGWGINHPLPAPDWAAAVFTLHAIVPKTRRATQPDLLKEYQQKVDPYGKHKRLVLQLLCLLLTIVVYWNWEQIMLLFQARS